MALKSCVGMSSRAAISAKIWLPSYMNGTLHHFSAEENFLIDNKSLLKRNFSFV